MPSERAVDHAALKIAFYAPLKPPDHPIPSGDRRVAQLLMSALRHAGHEVRLVSRFRSRDGLGDRQRQLRLQRIGRRLASRLSTDPRPGSPTTFTTRRRIGSGRR